MKEYICTGKGKKKKQNKSTFVLVKESKKKQK